MIIIIINTVVGVLVVLLLLVYHCFYSCCFAVVVVIMILIIIHITIATFVIVVPCELHMDLCYQSCSSGQPAVVRPSVRLACLKL